MASEEEKSQEISKLEPKASESAETEQGEEQDEGEESDEYDVEDDEEEEDGVGEDEEEEGGENLTALLLGNGKDEDQEDEEEEYTEPVQVDDGVSKKRAIEQVGDGDEETGAEAKKSKV
ncbi:hypothetical protein CPB85DRAFT_1432257 [Mucidula mucida]|nr:hypothetical protein CPB85DRAFT_1432257 [Mucidula mucida]